MKGDREREWGVFCFEKFKSGRVDPFFFVVGALTQHAWHAKSQTAATFHEGAMRVFAATTPSSILCPHPLRIFWSHQTPKNV